MNLRRSGVPAGAERLLQAMVKGGLPEDVLHAGAGLALLLDEPREVP
jgi:hypothetical protein